MIRIYFDLEIIDAYIKEKIHSSNPFGRISKIIIYLIIFVHITSLLKSTIATISMEHARIIDILRSLTARYTRRASDISRFLHRGSIVN